MLPLPIRRRPSRTHSLPALLASISEEHDGSDGGVISKADPAVQDLKSLVPSKWSGSDPAFNARKVKLRIRTKNTLFDCDRTCGICFDLAVRPSRTRCCGIIFCEDHLNDWLKGSTNRCPACTAPCHPQTGTISLASPISPTIHRSHGTWTPHVSSGSVAGSLAIDTRGPESTTLLPMLNAVSRALNQTAVHDENECATSPWSGKQQRFYTSPVASYFTVDSPPPRAPSPIPIFSPVRRLSRDDWPSFGFDWDAAAILHFDF
ncbi:hypothetical protein BDP27DRAFT_1413723 [Rhodocollybia butyracea]|uniref:RING-type domain-containing protein n=1 Tax=Rhodocollybia butyracea TaxID=206335 RepID=A0A9P5UGB8_9AGAR|nr:hypothetical protein BDP27DRAFT_1413723 [Rhodocollybia butyracea]